MWVARPGVRIHCQIVGDGPTVILQTGGAGDGQMWQEYLPFLTGFRVVLLDHRGRGESSRPDQRSAHAVSEYVADAVEVIEAMAAGAVGFVGYSMGAQVGYALAASRPDLVTSLVGLGVIGDEAPDPTEGAELANFLRTSGMEGLIEAVESEEGVELPDWLRAQFLATDAEQFALSVEAFSDWTPWPSLTEINCPTLLVAGALEDPTHLNETAADRLRRGRAAWLADCGHVGAFLAVRQQCELIVPHLRATIDAAR